MLVAFWSRLMALKIQSVIYHSAKQAELKLILFHYKIFTLGDTGKGEKKRLAFDLYIFLCRNTFCTDGKCMNLFEIV
jgi:hypothetical protein